MIVSAEQIKEHLNITSTDDDALLGRQIAAAQDKIERTLGFKIEETFGGVDQEEIPSALIHAVCLLVGHWYENREASTSVALIPIPLGVDEIVREFRNYTYGG